MKLLTIALASIIITSSLGAINPKTMQVYTENWQANTKWFDSKHDLSEKTPYYELADFVQSYENLKAATDELLITTMPVVWQKALMETENYLNSLAPLYNAIKEELEYAELSENANFDRLHNWITINKNLINTNTIKIHIATVNNYLAK